MIITSIMMIVRVANGQVTACPGTQDGTAACTSCPTGYVSCSQTASGTTSYGGCSPSTGGYVVEAVSVANNVGYCYYCPTGQSFTGLNDIPPNVYVTCDGTNYGLTGGTAPSAAPVIRSNAPLAPGQSYTPSLKAPSSASGGSVSQSSCFAGSETLLMENGATITMEEVQVGDKVLVASLDGKSTFYSAVMVSPHAANSIEARFVQLTTVSGKDVKMTADHLLMSGVCGGPLSLVQASSVKVGACLATVSGEEAVSAVSSVVGNGIYTVVPEKDSLLIVNGVVASPFAVNHMIANAFYNIHRTLAPFAARNGLITKAVAAFGELVVSA